MAPTRSPSIWDERTLGPESILLDDRVAVVTGAAQGIGEATAIALARCGAHVAICDRKADELAGTALEIERLGRRTLSAVLDVREQSAVQDFFGEVGREFGSLQILVNNAGGGFWSEFLDVSAKGERALVNENWSSVTHCVRAALPLMTEGGSVINITSVEAHRAGPGFAIYSAMKAAVANLSKSLSMEFASRSIRVNCVAPDMIPTPGDADLARDSAAADLPALENTPWPETGSSWDCAAAALFLASDLSRFITGSTIHVDGGTEAAGGWKITQDGGYTL
ncbi:MAG: SDR family oxidoreductase [Myxococcales bacterium]|nr:SDR family oxidoreductase [Myxococcales bacterium]